MPLPNGWEEVLDEKSGDFFYWHVETDHVQWEPPPVSKAQAEAAKGGAAAGAGAKKRGKRDVIMAESYNKTDGNFVLPVIAKSDAAKSVIRDALQGSAGFLFSSLSPQELEQVVMAMSKQDCKPGHAIITQGEDGDAFYIVETGNFDIEVNGNKVASRGAGAAFGELALLYNCPRAATVIASTDAVVWGLDRQTFRYMIASTREDQLAAIIDTLRQVKLLSSLSDEQLNKIADAVQEMSFEAGDKIINKGEEGNSFYMIKTGDVLCTEIGSGDQKDIPLKEGSYFGERALLLAEPRAANVIAQKKVTCLMLDRKAFVELLGPLRDLLDHNLKLRVVSALAVLSGLSEKEKDVMADSFQTFEVAQGAKVLKQGAKNDTFYVVKSGKVQGPKGEMGAGGHFGEKALQGDDTADGDYIATEPLVVFGISRSEFEAMRAKAASMKDAPGAAAGASGGDEVGMRDMKTVKSTDLEIMRTLGAGTFGRVKLCRHKPTGKAMALKILQKAQIVAYGQQKNVMNERDVMAMMDHPFVLKLMATYTDRNCLFMVLEYVAGGELFTLLANQPTGCLSSEDAKFYGAGVIAGLGALHEKYILYRDLKPENMLIDSEGFIKIIDLGFAKVVKDRTYTLCGTPEYLAPELVLGKGHGKGVDYWAVGVLIYEMLCGVSPFADDSQDQMIICKKIVKGKYNFPGWMRDKDAKDIINKLLTAKVTQRLGCKKGGVKDIMEHKWFKGMDWDVLQAKKMASPWVPPLKDTFDTSHFDPYEEEEIIEPYEPDGTKWEEGF